jgi:hypothetical protein
MTVLLHTRKSRGAAWIDEPREFARIPSVGECVTRSSDSPWYEVRLVVHTPFECD